MLNNEPTYVFINGSRWVFIMGEISMEISKPKRPKNMIFENDREAYMIEYFKLNRGRF